MLKGALEDVVEDASKRKWRLPWRLLAPFDRPLQRLHNITDFFEQVLSMSASRQFQKRRILSGEHVHNTRSPHVGVQWRSTDTFPQVNIELMRAILLVQTQGKLLLYPSRTVRHLKA